MSDIFAYSDADLYCHHTIDLKPNPDNFPMHAHERLEVLYFISGIGNYMIEGNQYPLQEGDVLVMRPSETHKLNIQPNEPYERIAFHFDPDLFDFIDPERQLLRPFLDRPAGQQNRYAAGESHSAILQTAFADFTFDGMSNVRLHLISRILLFLTSLQKVYNQLNYLPAPAQDLPRQLVAYVNDHLFEDISLQSVADAFFLSRSQISRIFHQVTGSPLWEYVILKRLLAARAMLQRGESAAVAASACGFADYSAFFRAYRTQFGHSPRKDCFKPSGR